MRRWLSAFGMILALTSLAASGCRTGGGEGGDGTLLSGAEAAPPGFVGCRPSAGECRYSCPERNGEARTDEALCPTDSQEPYACFCGDGDEAPPAEPSEDTHYFIGCRFEAGECRDSCASRQGIVAVRSPSRCPQDLGEGPFACFCAN